MKPGQYPLRRTWWTTAVWHLTSPIALVATIIVLAAAVFAAGAITARAAMEPRVYRQVTITAPTLAERVDNEKLQIHRLSCTGSVTLRLTYTTQLAGYITVNGPNQAEAAGVGTIVMEMRADAGDYEISYAGQDSTLDWSTSGAGGSCADRT